MEKILLTKLSNEISTLLNNEDTCDIVIVAGTGMDQMQFKGHSLILCARSEYFAETIKQRMNIKEEGLQLYRDSFIDLSYIPSNSFELIFRYLYSGVIDLSKLTVDTIFTLIDPLHELYLHDLIDYIQEYLIANRHRWIYTEFISTYYILADTEHIPKFRQFVDELVCNSPELLLRSEDFTIIDEDLLTDLLRKDDINMPAAEMWDKLLEWAAANPIISADTTLSQEKMLANTLKDFLPLVRFFQMSKKEFLEKVLPLDSIIPRDLFRELVSYYLIDTDDPILPATCYPYTEKIEDDSATVVSTESIIDSVLVDWQTVAWFACCIQQSETTQKLEDLLEYPNEIPFIFTLLMRGSEVCATASKFHNLCDYEGPTITILKIFGTDEIIGGYNPNHWSKDNRNPRTRKSFLFAIGQNSYEHVISRVVNTTYAVHSSHELGPCFGFSDLRIEDNFMQGYYSYARHDDYEGPIRESTDSFRIEEIEVFRVEQKRKELLSG